MDYFLQSQTGARLDFQLNNWITTWLAFPNCPAFCYIRWTFIYEADNDFFDRSLTLPVQITFCKVLASQNLSRVRLAWLNNDRCHRSRGKWKDCRSFVAETDGACSRHVILKDKDIEKFVTKAEKRYISWVMTCLMHEAPNLLVDWLSC